MKRQRYVSFSADNDELNKFIKTVSGDKEGRKVTRNSARAALEIFNVETGENAGNLHQLKNSGKGWRKTLKKKSSYLYRISATAAGKFTAKTGINYRKAVLRVSHLVERGFNHTKAGRLMGNWYRMDAFRENQSKVMNTMLDNLKWGWGEVARTGKAPTAAQMRRRQQ